MRGNRPVDLAVTISRFHAQFVEAEPKTPKHVRPNAGLHAAGAHDIVFVAQVVDARTGAVLADRDRIEASLPALAGTGWPPPACTERSQRSPITMPLEVIFGGWPGVGPDPRRSFRRHGIRLTIGQQ